MQASVLAISHSFMDFPDPKEGCITVFLEGCHRRCTGCHNEDLWEIKSKNLKSHIEVFGNIKQELEKWRINNVAIMGGEPLEPYNITFTKNLLIALKENNISSILYTGFDIEYVKENGVKGFTFVKTGVYDSRKKQVSGKSDERFVLASTNQSVYDSELKKLSKKGILNFQKENIDD